MTPRRTIASYDQLQDVFRRRKEELGLSNDQVDEICGFTRGHFDKLIGGKKNFGPGTLAPLMAAFNMVLVAEEGAVIPAVTITDQRNEAQVRGMRSQLRMTRKAHLERVLSDPDHFKKAGRKGGHARKAKHPANHLSEIGRRAARARWKRVKESRGSSGKADAKTKPPTERVRRRSRVPGVEGCVCGARTGVPALSGGSHSAGYLTPNGGK